MRQCRQKCIVIHLKKTIIDLMDPLILPIIRVMLGYRISCCESLGVDFDFRQYFFGSGQKICPDPKKMLAKISVSSYYIAVNKLRNPFVGIWPSQCAFGQPMEANYYNMPLRFKRQQRIFGGWECHILMKPITLPRKSRR